MHFVIHWKLSGPSGDVAAAYADLNTLLLSVPIVQLLDGLAIVRPSPLTADKFLANVLNVERAHDPVLDVAAFQVDHGNWYMVSEPVDVAGATAIAGRPPAGP